MCLLAAACLPGALGALAAAGETRDHRGSQFMSWTVWTAWDKTQETNRGETILTSKVIETAIPCDELVLSWNVRSDQSIGLKLEARALYPSRATKYYVLGLWSSDPSRFPRQSVRGQQDLDGDVRTDTLVLKQPCTRVQLRITLTSTNSSPEPALKFLGLSLVDSSAQPPPLPANQAAWGKSLVVPERSQVDYPGGAQAWCSPTSTSMVLAFWARQLNRPALDHDVPEVVKGVFDSAWPGTGNWPFNTAFAGSLAEMRAYVTRLTDVAELEDWVAQGIPVVVSVAYDLLRDKRPRRQDDGHLVVCCGFTSQGDVIVNDPGTSKGIRRVFPRAQLVAAWAMSHNTVYLIHPERLDPPPARFGHW